MTAICSPRVVNDMGGLQHAAQLPGVQHSHDLGPTQFNKSNTITENDRNSQPGLGTGAQSYRRR